MQEPERYFLNSFPESVSSNVDINVDLQKQRTVQLVSSVCSNSPKTFENANGGLYVGNTGISYMLYHIAENPIFEDHRIKYLEDALSFLQGPLQYASQSNLHKTDKTAFLTGSAGIYAMAVILYKKLGNLDEANKCLRKFVDISEILQNLNWFSNGGDELFVGRAGYLCAVLWIEKEINSAILSESQRNNLLDLIIESGEKYAQHTKSFFPLMYHYYGTEYLGAAHGLAGILVILLSFPDWLSSRSKAQALIKQSVDVFLSLQSPNGNFPTATDEINPPRPEHQELVHWCHGAPGVIYLMLKAYQVYEDKKYLMSSLKCAEVTWQKGLLKKGPGICHGVSGSGYVFLVLYRITKNPAHLYRAAQFMNFMYSEDFKRAKSPDCPYSLYEGLAGTACFSADLTNPLQAFFPLFNFFV